MTHNRTEIEYAHMHKYTNVCNSTQDLELISEQAHIQSYIKKRIYRPEGNWCYEIHLIKNILFNEDLNNLRLHSNVSEIKVSELSELMEGELCYTLFNEK